MRRFPLYYKIVGWFFLNLLLLGAAGYFFLGYQFHTVPELLLSGRAGERLQAIITVLGAELRERKQEEWGEILTRFTGAYGVQFSLFRMDGIHLAGEPVALPKEVTDKLNNGRPGRGPGTFRGSPREFPPGPEDGPPDQFRPPPRVREQGPPPRPPFIARAGSPPVYWIGAQMLGPEQEQQGPRRPVMLVIKVPSLSAGGLLLDVGLWVWVAAAVFLFSVLFWLPFVRSITRSIKEITNAAAEISEGKFDARVKENRRDELGALGTGINRMANRLAGYVSGQKRFLGDIAHELCSPIGRIQMALGIIEQRADEKQKAYVDDLRDEVQQMSNLVNELLSFSKASLGPTAIKKEAFGVKDVIDQAIRREAQANAQIEVEVEGGISAMGDPDLMTRAVSNLLRNAIRYAADEGPIAIRAVKNDDKINISVADSGPGVPEDAVQKLFDPFFRVDEARARETGGVGLGLTIVKSCVEACGGKVTCRNLQPKGFEVAITIPSAVASD